MTKDEALKMAIKEMTDAIPHLDIHFDDYFEAINACKEALEQPAQEVECSNHPDAPHGFCRDASHSAGRYVCECEGWQVEQPAQEPVAWTTDIQLDWLFNKLNNTSIMWNNKDHERMGIKKECKIIPLYTHPHQWQGLADNEIEAIYDELFISSFGLDEDDIKYARAIEQALKEKNANNI